jgi:hypothetical protein
MKLRILLILSLLSLLPAVSSAQIRFRVAGGISTDWITSDNPAVYRIVPEDADALGDGQVGGAFDGAQMGWGLRGYIDLDKQKKFRIPVGVDVFSYSGAQSIQSDFYSIRVQHENTLTTGLAGFEWSFVEFPWAFARAYLGAEARVLFVGENLITYDEKQIVNGELQERFVQYNGKPSTTVVGALARLGIEGEVYYPVFINTSIGWGAMNLIGRDERPTSEGGRGELLTPVSRNEGPEQILYHVNFTFMIQVRL